MAPPLLQERGLIAALMALAERNPIPTSLSSTISAEIKIEPAVQQGIYFIIAELLANTVKHSQASRVTIECSIEKHDQLCVRLRDNGVGNVKLIEGHGLARLVKALIRQRHDTRLFAVGDDWQSILTPMPTSQVPELSKTPIHRPQ